MSQFTQKVAAWRDRFIQEVDGEQGSLILDVLIGMAIFALVALIAVSAVDSYRQHAYLTSVTSDAQSIGLAVEAKATDSTYPASLDDAAVESLGQHLTKDDTVSAYSTDGVTGFCLVITHDDDAYAIYDSTQGGITTKQEGSGLGLSCTVGG
ncbi:hypothetical protein [Nocardioides sp. KR10-350]|uniref:hypothetical protein n=1 Tax=Nocardioides cheoyonin TaxID=3156615 RepID=UPI0032B5B16E